MRLVGGAFEMQPAYECRDWSCMTLCDLEGNVLPQDDTFTDEDDDPEDTDDVPDPYGGHVGFFADVDGEPIHVLGDPNMSEETLNALRELARAARKAIDDGTLPRKSGDS